MELSKTDAKILRAVHDSHGRRLSLEEMADKAGVSPERVHRRLQDQSFRELFLETIRQSLVVEVPEILSAFVDRAKHGDFKHGKLILEMSGAYEEKSKAQVEVSMSESPFKSEEDRKKFVKATLEEFVGGREESEAL